MKEFWNERYSQETFAYGTAPNAFFAEQIQGLSPGTALLPCEGEGRNAAYLAEKGWQVEAFDYSESGRQKTQRLAGKLMDHIKYHVADAQAYYPQEQAFDLVGLFFTHLPPEWRMEFFQRLPPALKPGGQLILEGFHPDQVGKSSGGPPNPALMFTLDDVRQAFPSLAIEQLYHTQTTLHEGPYHEGLADVTRFVGLKKQ